MTSNAARIIVILAAIAAAAALRLVPHPPNFTPIGAMALFGGAYLGRRAMAFVAPLAALLLSDLVLGFYPGIGFVYGAVALTVLIGWAIPPRRPALAIGGAAIAGSLLFFVLTNFGMWAFSGIYSRSWDGLVACYVAAIPFFQNSLAGDLFYSAVLFGGFAALERLVPALGNSRSVATSPAGR